MRTPEPTQIATWEAAERNAAAWMRHWGYDDASVTQSGADGGVDVRSRRALSQVKFEAKQVGRPALQRLVGARGLNHHLDLLFFTGAGYSAAALDYALDMGIALFVYGLDGTMTAVSPTAKELLNKQEPSAEPIADDASATRIHTNAASGKSRKAGWWSLGVGIALLWSLVAGLFNSENWSDGGSIALSIVTMPLLAVCAYFLIRFGRRRLSETQPSRSE